MRNNIIRSRILLLVAALLLFFINNAHSECCCDIEKGDYCLYQCSGSPVRMEILISFHYCFDPEDFGLSGCSMRTYCGKHYTSCDVIGASGSCQNNFDCIASYLLEDDDTRIDILRQFRDEVLSQTLEGQKIISLYNEWSPAIVKAMDGDEEFKEDVKEMLDGVLEMIE